MDHIRPRLRVRRRHRYLLWLLLGALALLALGASPALAAPPDALDLAGLQAKLASGPVEGTMKTSLSGTTVSDIAVRVLAVVDGFDWGKLIMFESTDPAITGIGGVAAGMSGSPIYVNDGGVDKLVGAVSYGDWSTLRGTGLATPIEYMMRIQAAYGPPPAPVAEQAISLDRPVRTSAGTVQRIVLAADAAAAGAVSEGTVAVHPLAVVQIAGLPRGSESYQRLAATLRGRGLTVIPASTNVGASAATTPPLQSGSPCGVEFSSGFFKLYVLGTATYLDGDQVLLFGHPVLGGFSGYFVGIGAMDGALCGATVDAIWPSSVQPYKMMTPADAKGLATRDNWAGVLASLGGTMTTFPITTVGTVEGGEPVTDVTDMSHWFATVYWPDVVDDWGWSEPGIVSYAVAAGLAHALDADPLQGSAATTTTVVVNDGAADYTVTHDNIWDNDALMTWWGLSDMAGADVSTLLAGLLDDPYGLRDVTVKSVAVEASFSSERRYAGLTDVALEHALREGDNPIGITYYRHGSAEPQTLMATLNVPKGTTLGGRLYVMSAPSYQEYFGYDYSESGRAPESLDDIVLRLNDLPGNGDVIVCLSSDSWEDDEDYYWSETADAMGVVPSPWVMNGIIEKPTERIDIDTPVARTGVPLTVWGYVPSAAGDVSVDLYRWQEGDPEPSEPSLTVIARHGDEEGGASFAATLPALVHNGYMRAEVAAQKPTRLPGSTQSAVKVRARLSLAATLRKGYVRLVARVAPKDAGGQVEFQRRRNGRWIAVAKAAVNAEGVARAKFAAKRITRVRARYMGSPLNVASTWVVR
jgi:hypothetical protein